MIKTYKNGVYLINNKLVDEKEFDGDKNLSITKTITYKILSSHNQSGNNQNLKIKFDALASHDITYVGIVQTARASGMEKFPLPYVLTNCHNSLCAVGGTINEDDHLFGLSAAKKYGGIYVPPHIGVIHQYMREKMAGCGKMILGSDSHTRYGALGTMAIGEGGGELVKQLLEDTYDIKYPEVVAVYLDNKASSNIGPQDISLAIIKEVYNSGYVKNKIMEFVGPGIKTMDTDFRNGVDVMTTETTCLSSIWETDEETKEYLTQHLRKEEYKKLTPEDGAYYDGAIYVDLSTIKPMIAMPFHPSNVYEIDYVNNHLEEVLNDIEVSARKITNNPNIKIDLKDKIIDGKLQVQQGIIAGCAGGNYSNIMAASYILDGADCGNDEFSLSVYPSSQAVLMDITKKQALIPLYSAGAIIKTAFCGPCFGAGDTPANDSISIRHTTRNFPSREGSKPGDDQLAFVALMDAKSIAVTAKNGGILTACTNELDDFKLPVYQYDDSAYNARVYDGNNMPMLDKNLRFGPNIKEWPEMKALSNNVLLKVCSKIMDEVTTTDELIPSGETSAYRSNPLKLAEFTLSRRDPEYVGRSKAVFELEENRQSGLITNELDNIYIIISTISDVDALDIQIGSMIYAKRPGDGSAREQAASCQKVIGGLANICLEYATKRYRSNVINWGMLPFQLDGEANFDIGDYIFIPNIRKALDSDYKNIQAYIIKENILEIKLYIDDINENEKEIIKAGCLINFNNNRDK
jgi:aconitate hydratase